MQDYSTDVAGSSHAESDMLLRKMMVPNGSDLTSTCVTYSSIVRWSVESRANGYDVICPYHGDTVRKWQATVRGPWYGFISEKVYESSTEGVRLYQLDSFFNPSNWKMGVASDKVRLGDLICWVASSRMAIILRPQLGSYTSSWTLHAVGTAALAKDLRGTSPEAPEEHYHRYRCFPSALRSNAANLTVHLEAAFVFILLESGRIFNGLEM